MTHVASRRRGRLLAALASFILLLGWTAAAPASAAAGPTLSGTVVLPTGAPAAWLEATEVFLFDSQGRMDGVVEPDSTGRYEFAGLEPGFYRVGLFVGLLEVDGVLESPPIMGRYFPGVDSLLFAEPIDLTAGSASGIDLTTVPARTVAGHVALPAGAPAEWYQGVTVEVASLDGTTSGASWPVEADGDYAVTRLSPGRYSVEFSVHGYRPNGLGSLIRPGVVGQFYGGAPTAAGTRVLDLTAGDRLGVDARLSAGRNIAGHVSLPADATAEERDALTVRAVAVDGDATAIAEVAADGSYAIAGLVPGDYLVAVDAGVYYDDALGRWAEPNLVTAHYALDGDDSTVVHLASRDASGIDMAMSRGRTISGRVTAPAGTSASVFSGMWISFRGDSGTGWAAQVGADGTYALTGLEPGEYTIAARVRPATTSGGNALTYPAVADGYVAGATPAAISVVDGDVADVDIALGSGRVVSGTVTFEGGVTAAEVPERVEVCAVATLTADAVGNRCVLADPDTGAWRIDGLLPAEYRFDFSGVGYLDQGLGRGRTDVVEESLGSAEGADGTWVDLAAANVAGIDAELALGVAVSGALAVPAGAPLADVADVTVTLVDESTGAERAATTAPLTGAWIIDAVPAGDYRVEFAGGASLDGFREYRVTGVGGVEVLGGDVSAVAAVRAYADDAMAGSGVVLADVSPYPMGMEYSAFFTEISWFAAQGITTGYPNGDGTAEYRPFGNVTRDAMAAFLFRFAGSPSEYVAPAVSPFTDVSPSKPFYTEICWLAEQGITTGWDVGGGRKEFRPYDTITRDAMAAFLYRFAGVEDWTAPAVSPFVDVPTSNGFYDEITWLADTGITTGWSVAGKKEFRPFASITRDAMAAFLYRYASLTAP